MFVILSSKILFSLSISQCLSNMMLIEGKAYLRSSASASVSSKGVCTGWAALFGMLASSSVDEPDGFLAVTRSTSCSAV